MYLLSKTLNKKVFILLLIATLLMQQQRSYAQAQPVANFVVNRAVAGVITRVAAARGFAANDARIAATMTGASAAMTSVNVASTAAGIGLTLAGAPVWLTVLGGLAVLGVGAAIVAGTTQISVQSTESGNKLQVVTASFSTTSPGSYTAPTSPPSPFAFLTNNGQEIYRDLSCYASQPCYAFPPLPAVDIPIQWKPYMSSEVGPVVVVYWSLESFKAKWTPWGYPPGVFFDGGWYTPTNLSTAQWVNGPTWDLSQSSKRLIGNLQLNFQDANAAPPILSSFVSTSSPLTISPNFGAQQYANLDTAYAAMSSSTKAQPISNGTLAKVVDQAWQRAASQPGYQGLPYSYTQPVTEADVQPWAAANPSAVPTIGDLLTPASNPGTTIVPISTTVTPSSSTSTNTDPSATGSTNVNVVNTPNVNVINQVQVDLGQNPNIGSPTLESTPTAQMILQPLLDLFPSLRSFVVPSHSSECPKPSLSIFGKTIVMESHCTLVESVRPTLYAVMAFVWVVLALLIVLAA